MKIIFSRKGFDSESGGCPSPILSDGKMISLPIPDKNDLIKYSDLRYDKSNTYYDVITNFKKRIHSAEGWNEFNKDTTCHFDPDINFNAIKRDEKWRGVFGQCGGAQKHLENRGVKEDDIFLFFGWFRRTIYKNNKLVFDPSDKDGKHILYGYMQVHEIINDPDKDNIPSWMKYHPHVGRNKVNNKIYVAKKNASWNENIRGYGVFNYSSELILSKEGYSKSRWDLPDIFKKVYISHHKENNWKQDYFQSVGRGQEFVVDANDEIIDWAVKLIENNCKKRGIG
ncbi:hypothetical protein SH2C18_19410 [Clostridium sediminicola]|uniref:Nmad3 family putative nucleotide modification protein n=1 Tax=Clostridium sediminicola TaxID=3114879 RepID=UPI0031F21A79